MNYTVNRGFQYATSGEMFSDAWHGVKGAADRAENGITNTWYSIFYGKTGEAMDKLYGRNMRYHLAAMGSIQTTLAAAEVIPITKGTAIVGKGAVKLGEKGLEKIAKNKFKHFIDDIVPNERINIKWGEGIQKQGEPWEIYIQSKLPEGTLDLNREVKKNFKAFDHYDPNTRRAISDKTLDTMTKTYNNPREITRGCLQFVLNAVATRFLTPPPRVPLKKAFAFFKGSPDPPPLRSTRGCLQFKSPSPCISNRCSLSTKQAARLSSSPWSTTSDLQSASGQPSSTQPNS